MDGIVIEPACAQTTLASTDVLAPAALAFFGLGAAGLAFALRRSRAAD